MDASGSTGASFLLNAPSLMIDFVVLVINFSGSEALGLTRVDMGSTRTEYRTRTHSAYPREDSVQASSTSDTGAIEAALPDLVSRLGELKGGLTSEESAVFDQLVGSAVHYAQESHHETGSKSRYAKPISAVETMAMKEQYQRIPEKLSIDMEGVLGER